MFFGYHIPYSIPFHRFDCEKQIFCFGGVPQQQSLAEYDLEHSAIGQSDIPILTMAALPSNAPQTSLLFRRLYRSLLKSAKPFCFPSPNAKVFSCLLHRAGFEDESWEDFLRYRTPTDADEASEPMNEENEAHHVLFRRLLREVISENGELGIRQMQFPSHVGDASHFTNIIRREFKESAGCVSSHFDIITRKETSFLALREMNKKLAWADILEQKAPTPHPRQPARFVKPLSLRPPSSYLRPGSFLIAHPNLSGYFRRSVICILDHTGENENRDEVPTSNYGTYGLIVNRLATSSSSGKTLSLEEVLKPLPDDIMQAFSGSSVREGGPVHMSLQMLHASSPERHANLQIGGTVLPMVTLTEDESTALHSDRAIMYKGDVLKAANSVLSGALNREDVSFFVGASSWAAGQLEGEIERGCWLPCRGPPDIAYSGICDHLPCEDGKSSRPKADLWLSMLSACGEDESRLAHLMYHDNGESPHGQPCDEL